MKLKSIKTSLTKRNFQLQQNTLLILINIPINNKKTIHTITYIYIYIIYLQVNKLNKHLINGL